MAVLMCRPNPVYTTNYDDSSPAFSYVGTGWQYLIFGNYYNLTDHLTKNAGERFSFA